MAGAMITWNERERSACGRERDLVPYDLPLKAANIARPLAVILVWLFLTQKEVLFPKYLKFRAGLPVTEKHGFLWARTDWACWLKSIFNRAGSENNAL